MELRHLKYFIAAAEEEHFGRAADRLHIVQPALSRQIRQLEHELGVALFDRVKRRVRLTAAGKAFLERSRSMFADLNNSVEHTRRVAEGMVGQLRVGFVESAICRGTLPLILRNFRSRVPRVELELVPDSSLRQEKLLRDGKLNLAFVYWPPSDFAGLSRYRLESERVVLALSRTNRLCKKRAINLGDLRGEPFVALARSVSPSYYDHLIHACDRGGLTMNIVQEANTDIIVLSLVAAGVGACFIMASAQRMKPPDVSLVPVENLGVTIHLEALWKSHDPSPGLRQFLKLLPGYASENGKRSRKSAKE